MTPSATGSAPALRSVNCTQCGAPLTLHGGHRVESITCGFCGSVLDAHDAYKVIKTFTGLERPPAPVAIGMRGTLKGVEFVIIGVVQYRDTDHLTWLEFALFSPTHGYAWLEYDHGHFVFSRRVRDVPDTPIVNRAKSRFQASGHEFKVFSRYRASVIFVEGELTYVAEVGDQVELTDGIAPPYIYTLERTGGEEAGGEEEYVLGEYLKAEDVYAAFGLEGQPPRVSQVHPAQPYVAGALAGGASTAGMVFTPVALLLLLYTVFFGSGSVVLSKAVTPYLQAQGLDGCAGPRFEIRDAGSPIELEARIPTKKSWSDFDIRVEQEGTKVFSVGAAVARAGGGYDAKTYWRIPRSEIKTYFRVPREGTYQLCVNARGGVNANQASGAVRVQIREGLKLSRYYLALLVLSVLAALLGPLARWRFEARRWEDEDDD